ncbi:Protein of unknown function [Cyclobacterium xiamenense]|uniref:DUF2911 domain-containing protein n=1 Tax=Cyclobacterium xiamenense TaxID=1297121 RepID=A0A1H6UHB1_9BACT|nr:DUF2911 domain-containing protein [Cyclobacterium xiamenense]SEI89147.1 Protein of unknown function [Cyclobacterium xiamenense]
MKKNILIGAGVLVLIFIIWVVYGLFFATPASPPATASYSQGGLEISIDYSQPSKKGRLIFGEEPAGALQPYGKYWRLGANAATEITFNQDVTFGGKPVDAGTYRMYAVPGADAFEVRLNSETGVFFGVAEPDYALDVVTVQAPVQKIDSVVETFTIDIRSSDNGAIVVFSWDDVLFTVPVTLQ